MAGDKVDVSSGELHHDNIFQVTSFFQCGFKEGSPVLLLTSLDPVSIDLEGASINHASYKSVLVWRKANAFQGDCFSGLTKSF